MWLFLFGVALTVWHWIVVKPSQLPPPPDHFLTRQITYGTERAWQTATGWIENRGWPFPAVEADLRERFRVWALAHLPTPGAQLSLTDRADFSAWLTNLTGDPWSAYVKALSAFCQALGFKLEWLWNERLPIGQRQALVEAIGLYSLAQWHRAQARATAVLTTWETAPERAHLPTVAQQLFLQLVNHRFVVMPPDLMLAATAERQLFMQQAILQAAREHPTEVMALLNTVMSGGRGAPSETALGSVLS